MDDEDDGLHVRAPTLADLARLGEALNRSRNQTLIRTKETDQIGRDFLASLIREEESGR